MQHTIAAHYTGLIAARWQDGEETMRGEGEVVQNAGVFASAALVVGGVNRMKRHLRSSQLSSQSALRSGSLRQSSSHPRQ